jgi:hypothetical protein
LDIIDSACIARSACISHMLLSNFGPEFKIAIPAQF